MPTNTTLRRLYALLHAYANEPAATDSDAAAERDLDYFDRMLGVLGRHDDPDVVCPICGQPRASARGDHRVRWEIDVEADSAVEAAQRARQVQLQPTTLATVFEVVRLMDGAAVDWSRADTVDLSALATTDQLALDEIAELLRSVDWQDRGDLRQIADLVQLTGRVATNRSSDPGRARETP